MAADKTPDNMSRLWDAVVVWVDTYKPMSAQQIGEVEALSEACTQLAESCCAVVNYFPAADGGGDADGFDEEQDDE